MENLVGHMTASRAQSSVSFSCVDSNQHLIYALKLYRLPGGREGGGVGRGLDNHLKQCAEMFSRISEVTLKRNI